MTVSDALQCPHPIFFLSCDYTETYLFSLIYHFCFYYFKSLNLCNFWIFIKSRYSRDTDKTKISLQLFFKIIFYVFMHREEIIRHSYFIVVECKNGFDVGWHLCSCPELQLSRVSNHVPAPRDAGTVRASIYTLLVLLLYANLSLLLIQVQFFAESLYFNQHQKKVVLIPGRASIADQSYF